jgi:hypothetical protein
VEEVNAFYATLRGSLEMHKLRAKEAIDFLEEYRDPQAAKREDAKRAAKYATPKEQAKREKAKTKYAAENARTAAAARRFLAGAQRAVSKREAASIVLGVRPDAPTRSDQGSVQGTGDGKALGRRRNR